MSLLRFVRVGALRPFPSLRMVSVARLSQNQTPATSESKKDENPLKILQQGRHHKVDNLEKRFLVWAGKYERIDEVPPTVPQETMEKARNKARIRISNYMMLATVLACLAFVYSGKKAVKRGESVQKMNLDWHKEYNEGSPSK